MAMQDKIANTVNVVKGKVKEAAGKVTGNPRLEAEGKLDQGIGHLKQVGEKLKDGLRDVFDRK